MKSNAAIKAELHQLIDSIEDEVVLNQLHDDVVPYIKEMQEQNTQTAETLTTVQQKELEEAIRQADAGEVLSWGDFLKATDRWRIK